MMTPSSFLLVTVNYVSTTPRSSENTTLKWAVLRKADKCTPPINYYCYYYYLYHHRHRYYYRYRYLYLYLYGYRYYKQLFDDVLVISKIIIFKVGAIMFSLPRP